MTGNESLAASLDSDAASELLSLGESVAKRIVNETEEMDDTAADEHIQPRLRALRIMLRAVGRWVGETNALSTEDQLALWKRAADQASIIFGKNFVMPNMGDAVAQISSEFTNQQVIQWLKKQIEQ